MEQIKILKIINRWGYLNTEQIALLINKQIKNVERQLSFLKLYVDFSKTLFNFLINISDLK